MPPREFTNLDRPQEKDLRGIKKTRKAEQDIRLGESEYTFEEKEIGRLEVSYYPEVVPLETSIRDKPSILHVRRIREILLTPPGEKEPISLLDLEGIPTVPIYVPVERQENYMYAKPYGADPFVLAPPIESTLDLFVLLHELGHVAQEKEGDFKDVTDMTPAYRSVGPDAGFAKQYAPLKKTAEALPDLPRKVTPEIAEAIDRIDAITLRCTELIQSHTTELKTLEREKEQVSLEEAREVEDLVDELIGGAISLPELFDLHRRFSEEWIRKSSKPDQLRDLEQEYLANLKARGVIMSRRLCDPYKNPFEGLLDRSLDVQRLPSGVKALRVPFDRYGDILLFDPEAEHEESSGGANDRTVKDIETMQQRLRDEIDKAKIELGRLRRDESDAFVVIDFVEAFLRNMLERDASKHALKWIHEIKRRGADVSLRMRVPWRHTVDGGFTETSSRGRILVLSDMPKGDKGPMVVKSPVEEAESALLTYKANISTMRKAYGGKIPSQLQPKTSIKKKM